ncbi:unnamed protein product [Toxocara canis]|uniref:Pepsin-I3 domain-containing protein n=1 Tax=Toxocara canis TaxID=6265 RepID=A0A183UKU5_TOXCA|nr:unnamed protein product [Toxocara canis]
MEEERVPLRFVRYLTAQDQRELARYQSKVAYWQGNLNEHIQHRINVGTNQYREAMNRAFGPGGSFHRAFTGPYWESQHLNTPPPTTLPPLPPELLVEVPVMPFPSPPAFCFR